MKKLGDSYAKGRCYQKIIDSGLVAVIRAESAEKAAKSSTHALKAELQLLNLHLPYLLHTM